MNKNETQGVDLEALEDEAEHEEAILTIYRYQGNNNPSASLPAVQKARELYRAALQARAVLQDKRLDADYNDSCKLDVEAILSKVEKEIKETVFVTQEYTDGQKDAVLRVRQYLEQNIIKDK